jgi:hypothetical protein
MKRLSVPLTPELHRQLKILAALRETSIADLVRQAVARAIDPTQKHPALRTQTPPPLHTRNTTR